ncbi:MAG TPA: inositol 2-dehydrogenase [Bryobacteraceae bacterium]|nr:inositol 2-dehydrogenase [Bryobacteraceae bacterium]
MTKPKLRFGVLGVGRIGKIHAGNLAGRIPGVELAALADVFPDELAAVAAKLNVGKTFADYRKLLELPEVDAVAICTPTNTHYQVVLDAAAAGKHIFCEKPIDLEIEKIVKINAEVEKRGVQLMVGFNRRYDPNFLKVHDTVKAGGIGEPHILRITSRDPGPPPETYIRASGGIFLDMTIHDFDMARYLMGDVTEVYARANVLVDPAIGKAGDWDTAMVTLTFANGALGAIDNSRKAVYGYDQRVEVFGSGGMIAVQNNTHDNHVRLDREGTHSALPLDFFMDRYTESYLKEMEAFVDAVRNQRPAPVNGNDGLMAVVMGLAAAKSVRENRPVKLTEIYERRG